MSAHLLTSSAELRKLNLHFKLVHIMLFIGCICVHNHTSVYILMRSCKYAEKLSCQIYLFFLHRILLIQLLKGLLERYITIILRCNLLVHDDFYPILYIGCKNIHYHKVEQSLCLYRIQPTNVLS